MNTRNIKLFFCCLLLLGITACTKAKKHQSAPKAVDGVLDLRHWDFEKDGSVRLDGDWGFYKNQLLEKGERVRPAREFIKSGKGWNPIDKPAASKINYGTYTLRVLLGKNQSKELGIKINEFSTAYELDINGTIIAANGLVTTNKALSVAEYKPKLCFIHHEPEQLRIVARVSNYHHFNGGLLQPIFLGKHGVLEKNDQTMARYGGFLYGLLVIIGLFHLGIFLFRRKETYNLYYSIYCIFSCVAFAFTNERYLFSFFGSELWSLSYKLHLSVVPIFISGLLLFYDQFFKGVIKPWLKKVLLWLGVLFVTFVIVTPTRLCSYMELIIPLYLLLMSIVAIVINSIAIYRKMESGILLFLCNLFFMAAFIYDGALIEEQMGTLTLTHLCTVVYVIVISYILSRRFASTFGEVEQLSNELVDANKKLEAQNKNLEAEVKLRTQQVVLAEKMAVLGQITANIAHEINTPLGAIKASINTVHESFSNSVDLSLKLIREMDSQSIQMLYRIVQEALTSEIFLSPKDERQTRKKMAAEMTALEIPNAHLLADYFVRAGFTELQTEYVTLLKQPGAETLIALLTEELEQVINTKNVRTAIEKVSKIMFALKNYSRHTIEGHKAETNVEADIDSVLMLYHNWLKRGVTVVTEYSGISPLSCWADELNQVWTNLIMNALQAMSDEGTLTITTSEKDGMAVISIADNGPGIPPELQDKIFEPFFTTKPHGEGSGLGLDIVKTIIKKHGGEIAFESRPGHTVFTLKIPYTA